MRQVLLFSELLENATRYWRTILRTLAFTVYPDTLRGGSNYYSSPLAFLSITIFLTMALFDRANMAGIFEPENISRQYFAGSFSVGDVVFKSLPCLALILLSVAVLSWNLARTPNDRGALRDFYYAGTASLFIYLGAAYGLLLFLVTLVDRLLTLLMPADIDPSSASFLITYPIVVGVVYAIPAILFIFWSVVKIFQMTDLIAGRMPVRIRSIARILLVASLYLVLGFCAVFLWYYSSRIAVVHLVPVAATQKFTVTPEGRLQIDFQLWVKNSTNETFYLPRSVGRMTSVLVLRESEKEDILDMEDFGGEPAVPVDDSRDYRLIDLDWEKRKGKSFLLASGDETILRLRAEEMVPDTEPEPLPSFRGLEGYVAYLAAKHPGYEFDRQKLDGWIGLESLPYGQGNPVETNFTFSNEQSYSRYDSM